MAFFDTLYQASFRGVPFLVKSSNTTGGRKTVTHEYPLSNRRFVEDLGKFERVFTVEAVINEPNYTQKREALLNALETAGGGVLVHPYYGTQDVVALQYSIAESDNALGEGNISMTFQRASLNIYPTQGSSNLSKILKVLQSVYGDVETDIANNFLVSGTSFTNYNAAVELVGDIADAFDDASRVVNVSSDNISSFSADLLNFRNDINANIRSANNLASSMTGLFNTINVIATDPVDQFTIFKNFFDFGDDLPAVEAINLERRQRQQNQEILTSAMQVNALSFAYATASTIDYTDTDQLSTIRNDLEAQYNKVSQFELISQDTFYDLQGLRNEMRIFFAKEAVNVPNIVTIETPVMPVSILSYQYYGTTDRSEQILNLNPSEEVSFIEGDIRILST